MIHCVCLTKVESDKNIRKPTQLHIKVCSIIITGVHRTDTHPVKPQTGNTEGWQSLDREHSELKTSKINACRGSTGLRGRWVLLRVMGHFTTRSLHSLKPSVTSKPIQNKLNLTSVTSQPIIYLYKCVLPPGFDLCCEFDLFYRSRSNNKIVMWCEMYRLYMCSNWCIWHVVCTIITKTGFNYLKPVLTI